MAVLHPPLPLPYLGPKGARAINSRTLKTLKHIFIAIATPSYLLNVITVHIRAARDVALGGGTRAFVYNGVPPQATPLAEWMCTVITFSK